MVARDPYEDRHVFAPAPSASTTSARVEVLQVTTLADVGMVYADLPERLAREFSACAQEPVWVVRPVGVSLGRLVSDVSAAGVPVRVHDHGRGSQWWWHVPALQQALDEDLAAAVQSAVASAESGSFAALLGSASVVSRDALPSTSTGLGVQQREVTVCSDRRVLVLDVSAELTRSGVVTNCVVSDLGIPVEVVVSADRVVVRSARMAHEPVRVTVDRREVVTGYKPVPLEVSLPDPVGPAVLMALVEAGAASVVTLD